MKKIFLFCIALAMPFICSQAQVNVTTGDNDTVFNDTVYSETVSIRLMLYGEELASTTYMAGQPVYIDRILYALMQNPLYADLNEKFNFIYNGMDHFGYPFLGWSKSDKIYDPFNDGDYVFSDITLYACFDANGTNTPAEPSYTYEWKANLVTGYEDMLLSMQSGLALFVIAAVDDNDSTIYFPAAAELADSYAADTAASELYGPLYTVRNRINMYEVSNGFDEYGTITNFDIDKVATFNMLPYYGDNAYYDTISGYSYPDGFMIQDFANKALYELPETDNNGHYMLGFYQNKWSDTNFWSISIENGIPYLLFTGASGMPLMLNYDSAEPYFFASMLDPTGTSMPNVNLVLFALTEEAQTIDTIYNEIYPVFDFNTVTFSLKLADLNLGVFEIDFDVIEELKNEDSIRYDIVFDGDLIIDNYSGDSAYIADSISELINTDAIGHMDIYMLEGNRLPIQMYYVDPNLYRVRWFSTDERYNDITDNRLIIAPQGDIVMTMTIETIPSVIIIAGDTITYDPDSVQVINITEDGSVSLDLTTNTLTLDSAAVTGTGISSELAEFTLSVENNSTIAVDEEFGIKFEGEMLVLQTDDSVLLTVQAPQPLVGNGGSLMIDGNFIFSSVEFEVKAGQAVAHRRNIRRMPQDANPLYRPAVSGFANVEMADGIEVREVYYTDSEGNTTMGDPTRTVYHVAEAAYGEVDVDTQSFTPATTLVFADSNFYTDYIDGKIDITTGLPIVGAKAQDADLNYYDILGRRIEGPQQGIYIFGGQVYLK